MKHHILLTHAMIVLSLTVFYTHGIITTFIPRSQGSNTARELVGWQRELYQNYCENYAAFAGTVEYTHSMHTQCLARNLLTTNCLRFAGSAVPNRNPKTDILADYFGMAVDFEGTLAIKPKIENYLFDLNWYFGLDEVVNGLYVRIHAPIVHTEWTLGLDPCITCTPKFAGCSVFPPCYMYSGTPVTECASVIPTLNPLVQANNNCTTDSLRVALSGNFTFGDMMEPWKFGRFSFCPRSKTGLADIDVILGMLFLHNDYAHFGAFFQTVIPTGNRPKAKYIFEPIVGNGKHWEFGGGATMHLSFNECTCPGLNAAIYIEGNVCHVFRTHQRRSFDFKANGPLSRYMLLKEYDPDCGNSSSTFTGMYTYNAGSATTTDVYKGLMNAINFATRNCEVAVGLKADVSAKLCLSASHWTLDTGYNFWYRSAERVCIDTSCPCYYDQRILGFKGTEPVCCSNYQIALAGGSSGPATIAPTGATFPVGSVAPDSCPALSPPPPSQASPVNSSSPSNATQANATIFAPGTPSMGTVAADACSVCINAGPTPPTTGELITDLTPANGYYVDTQPTLINCSDLDPSSAAQGRMMTHKVFGHLSYTWYQSCYNPHLGIGAEAEFDAHCDNALEQWGVWLKGGLEF